MAQECENVRCRVADHPHQILQKYRQAQTVFSVLNRFRRYVKLKEIYRIVTDFLIWQTLGCKSMIHPASTTTITDDELKPAV